MAGSRFMGRITRWLARRLHGLAARFDRLGGTGNSAPLPAPPDPELLALAARYPGAPEHWLQAIAAHLGPTLAGQISASADESPRRSARPQLHWPAALSQTPPVRAAHPGGGDASRAVHRTRLAVPARSSPRRGGLPATTPPIGSTTDHGSPGRDRSAPGPIGRIAQRLFMRSPGPSPDSRGASVVPQTPVAPRGAEHFPAAIQPERSVDTAWLGGEPLAQADPISFAPLQADPAASGPSASTGPWLELPASTRGSPSAFEPAMPAHPRQRFTPIGREPELVRFETFSGSPGLPWPALPPSDLGTADAEPTPPEDARFRHEQMVSQWNA